MPLIADDRAACHFRLRHIADAAYDYLFIFIIFTDAAIIALRLLLLIERC